MGRELRTAKVSRLFLVLGEDGIDSKIINLFANINKLL
jgi:hypothetical protein